MKTEIGHESGGTENVLEGFGAGIIEALERERQRLKKNAESEAARIIAEAKQQAEGTISQAEVKADQEAAERTRRDVEQILAAAREDSDRILAAGRRDAGEQSSKALVDARNEAEKVAATLTAEASAVAEQAARESAEVRSRAEQDAAEMVAKAHAEAAQIMKGAVDAARARTVDRQERIAVEASQEAGRIVGQALQRAKQALQEAAAAVGEAGRELREHSRDIKRQALERAVFPGQSGPQADAVPEPPPSLDALFEGTPASAPPGAPFESADAVQVQDKPLSVEQVLNSDTLFDRSDNSVLYCGEVELNIVPPADVHQLGEFQEHLKTVPHLEIQRFDRTASADLKITVVAAVAMPLFEIVRALPAVEEAEQIGKDILITLLPANKSKKRVAGRSDNG
jgi:vacuolar-type H+-ATPase subunit H